MRIVLGFDGDKSKLTLSEKTSSLLAKTATGRELPYAQLVYVWANTAPVGHGHPESAHQARARWSSR